MNNEQPVLQKVRLDKWLWSVRIFKSRTLATDACKMGRVKVNGLIAKPADSVIRGNLLNVRKEGYSLTFKVVDLIDKRVSAPLAAPCYENLTPPEEMNKHNAWFEGHTVEIRARGAGRPTKKERREIDTFKDGDDADVEYWDL
jgi:ribosome-associated heat shock protein Hsp15